MSCSHSINTYTNSKYIYRGVTRFKSSFSCGKCSSCIKKQRTDWRVRSYYESLHCLNEPDSFVLFDTLTYSDTYIKRYSDIFPELSIPEALNYTSFCRDDVQKFFKRLRINLKRSGHSFDSVQLRYILTSEYGTSERTRGFENTHRPHYHVLFFVSFPISPIEFSRAVSRAWHLGKTDGVRPFDDCSHCHLKDYCKGYCLYQSTDYVLNERLVTKNNHQNMMKCVNYVTKYISKDMYNSVMLQDRVDTLWNYLQPDYRSDIIAYRKYRKFCSQVLPFHLQSRYFGLSLLSNDDEREFAVRTNQVRLPTSDKNVVLSVALPRYYQRHLYYTYKKVDGRVVWKLSPFGVDTKCAQLNRKIYAFIEDYKAFNPKFPESKLFQLSLYRNVYRGTLANKRSLCKPYWKYYRDMITPHDDDEKPLYYNRNTFVDKLTIGKFLSTSYKVTSDGEIIFKGKQLHKEFIPCDGYYLINDTFLPLWNGFDKLLNEYDKFSSSVGLANDAKEAANDKNVDYYRQIGLLDS